jgi:hypothetical protein
MGNRLKAGETIGQGITRVAGGQAGLANVARVGRLQRKDG